MKPLSDSEIAACVEAMSAVFGGDTPLRFQRLLEQAKEANELRSAVLEMCVVQKSRLVTIAEIALMRHRANDRSAMFHQQVVTRRFWRASSGLGPTFSLVAATSTDALLLVALYCAECFPDEVFELELREVTEEDAKQQKIGGDSPCMLADMPYGDVACSEY
jgi:hypothetical protein